jgi:glutathione S-transferase
MMERYGVTGFSWVPTFAQGLNRDLRVRWALEEAGLPYDTRQIDLTDRKSDAYRQVQPFGMIPAFSADGLDLFESGAIVQLIAENSETLMPIEGPDRIMTVVWMYAALNTVEPPIDNLATLDLQHSDEEWAKLGRPTVVEAVRDRLAVLAGQLGGRDFLIGRFTAADILMATVLRLVQHTDLVASFPAVDAYLKRCEARPAFRNVLGQQMAEYAKNMPTVA